MNINKEKYIYDDLKEFYNKNKSQLYTYQDLELSGKNEYEISIKKSYQLKEYEKNRLSNELIEIIINVSKEYKQIKKLINYINANQVILYYDNYIKLLKNYLKYNDELKKNFDKFIINLVIKSSCEEIVKLGIISSCLCSTDNLKEILEVFTIHNEYIFYVIKCLTYLGENDKIFEICKNSYGYGKIFSVMNLSCVNKEMRNWLLEKGSTNNVEISELVEYCLLGGNLLKYFKENEYDKERFENVIMHFTELIYNYDIDEIEDGIDICLNIINFIEDKFGGIYSLYSIVLISDSIENSIFLDSNINDKTIKQRYNNMLSRCKDIYIKKEWHEVIKKEFDNVDIEGSILISCAQKTKYKIKKMEFKRLFNRNYKSPIIYRYAVTYGSPSIKKFLFYEGINKLNIYDLLTGPDNIKLENVPYDKIEQVCFFIIINYLKYEEFTDIYKDINLHALRSPIVETRYEAISNLNIIKELLDENDINFIKELIDDEVVKEIKRSLIVLLPKNKEKIIRYIDITSQLRIKPHVKDIYLNTIQISETNYVDMSEVSNKLFEEELVYLKRESTNVYDENAILVTTNEGYVLGYIPKSDNFILRNLMDNNKYIYGYIKSINDDYTNIRIDLYLSYEDVLEEITDTLTLLSNNYNSYLQ